MDYTESVRVLVKAASEKGVSVDQYLEDAQLALHRYKVVQGKHVVSAESKTPELCRLVNEHLKGADAGAPKRLRNALVGVAGDTSVQCPADLHGTVFKLSKAGAAPNLVKRWSEVIGRARPSAGR